MRASPLVQLSLAKVRGILREPEAIFWVVVFPVLLSISLGIAFRASGPTVRPSATASSCALETTNAKARAPSRSPAPASRRP